MTASARNPATLAKLRAEISLCRNDLLRRGVKIPHQPELRARQTMHVGGKEFDTFIVVRGEDYIDGKISLWALCRALDPGTVLDICDYADARKSGHLPAPDWAEEVST